MHARMKVWFSLRRLALSPDPVVAVDVVVSRKVLPIFWMLRFVLDLWRRCAATHRIIGLSVTRFSLRDAPGRFVHDSTELLVTRNSCPRFCHSFHSSLLSSCSVSSCCKRRS